MKTIDSKLEHIWETCCEIWFDLSRGQQLAIKYSPIPFASPCYEVVTIHNNQLQSIDKLKNFNSIFQCIEKTLHYLINYQLERKVNFQNSLEELRFKIEKNESEIADIEVDLTVLSQHLEDLK